MVYTAAVRGGIFQVLGTLSEVYPEVMVSMSDRLVDIYMKTLKTEMLSKQQKKKPDMPVIGGCLRGLCSYLTQFSQSVAEGLCVCVCVCVCAREREREREREKAGKKSIRNSLLLGSSYAQDIYKFTRMAIDTNVSMTRYEVPRGIVIKFTPDNIH